MDDPVEREWINDGLPIDLLARAKVVGDEESGFIWVVPSRLVCTDCWKPMLGQYAFAGMACPLRQWNSGSMKEIGGGRSRKPYATEQVPPPGEGWMWDLERHVWSRPCPGVMDWRWVSLQNFMHPKFLHAWRRGRRWKKEGEDPMDAVGGSAWRRIFTEAGALKNRPPCLEGIAA